MRPEYLELLKTLISFAPVTSDIPAVNRTASYLADFIAKKGLRVHVVDTSSGRKGLYVSALPTGYVSDYLFVAHLDVVPLSTPSQSTPVEKDGILYGRGAADCLGRAVCIAQILCDNPGCPAAALFSTDEEEGGLTLLELLKDSMGVHATKGVAILDSWRDGGIATAEKGMMNVRMTAHGRAGRTAYPWIADNAVDTLVRGYARLLDAWKNPTQEDNWQDSISATALECPSKAHNIVPDTASMVCNVRFTTPRGEADVVDRIRRLTGIDEIEVMNTCVPVFSRPDDPFVNRVKNIAERVRGREITLYRMNGATDARHVAQIYPDIPIVIDGSKCGNFHGPEEWLDLEDTNTLIQIYEEVIRS